MDQISSIINKNVWIFKNNTFLKLCYYLFRKEKQNKEPDIIKLMIYFEIGIAGWRWQSFCSAIDIVILQIKHISIL